MNIVSVRENSYIADDEIVKQKLIMRDQSFARMNARFGLLNFKLEELLSCNENEVFELVSSKFNLLSDNDPTQAEAEVLFLWLRERFREVGNRNIYGNRCAVFTPPPGFKFNEEVANTYYYMYDNVLNGSKALTLWTEFVNKSVNYSVKGGSLSMLRWIKDVAVPVAYKEWEMEQANELEVLEPTLTYLANQSNQSALTVAYIFG